MNNDSNESPPSLSPREYLNSFAGYTTLHGLHFVFEPHGNIRRLVWLILILGGLGVCTRQLVESYRKLRAHNHVNSKEFIPSDKLPFPAVTFCNVNMMRKSKIQGTEAQFYLDQLNVLKSTDLAKEFPNRTLNSSFDIAEAVSKYGHTAKDMIVTCTWDGEFCGHTNVTTFLSQLYGLCHTFNPGKDGHPLLSSTSIKKSHGLLLYLHIDYLDYYGISSYFSTGIRLVIHDQNESPMVEVRAINIMPSQTTIMVVRNEYQRLPLPYKSACGSRKLETSSVYTRSVCLQECQTRKIIKQCGCKLLGMPDLKEFNGTKNCSPETMTTCGLLLNVSLYNGTSRESLLTKYFLTIEELFSNNNPDKDCDCPKPCNEVNYEIVQINSVDMLSDSFWNETYEMQAKDLTTQAARDALNAFTLARKNAFRNDYIALMVHYEGLHTLKTTEREAYDFTDFGSDVGGYLGLFLGCSILTVFELLDFLFLLCYTRGKPRNKTNDRVFEVNVQTQSKF